MTKEIEKITLEELAPFEGKEEEERGWEILRAFSYTLELADLAKVLRDRGLHEDQDRILAALITLSRRKSCRYP